MSSFCVLCNRHDPQFSVEKLDINIWVLPGILGRRVLYCDVGVKIRPSTKIPSDELERTTFRIRLGLPFVARDDIRDLTHLFWSDHKNTIANGVFGNSEKVTDVANGVTIYDDGAGDGKGIIAFCGIDRERSRIEEKSEESQYSIASLVVPNRARDEEANYVRVRFRVDESRQLWRWHNVSGRRRFAVSDIRVNEFRETPRLENAPNFPNEALEVERVHCLVIFSSKLMIIQSNPYPRYIRVLEMPVWRSYVGRKLSRSDEVFVITYWKGENITADEPFRAFLDVERRKLMLPVPTLVVMTAVSLGILLILVEHHYGSLGYLSWNPLGWSATQVFWGVIAIGGFLLTALAFMYGLKPDWLNGRRLGRKIEQWWFR